MYGVLAAVVVEETILANKAAVTTVTYESR